MYDLKALLGDARQQLDQDFLERSFSAYRLQKMDNWLVALQIRCEKIASEFAQAVDNFTTAIEMLRAGDHSMKKLTRKRRALRIGKMRLLRKQN